MIAAAAMVACSPQAPANPTAVNDGSQQGLREIPVMIHSSNGNHRFTAEVAATPLEQQLGLMHRRALASNHGMIFPFANDRIAAFWMKNTVIPLDMIFVRRDGTIAHIETAQPLNLALVSAYEPVAAVFEIAGGRSAELGVAEGDSVEFAP